MGVKKIALIGTQPPMVGGISTHIKSLKTRLRQHGFKTTVIDIFNTRKDRKQAEGEVLSGKNPVKLLMNIFHLERKGYDIFHFHSSRRAYAFLTAVLFVKLLNKKVILSLHHGGFNEWLLKYKWRRVFYLFFFSFADKIIFMNPDDAERFKEISSVKNRKIIGISPFIADDEKLYQIKYPGKNHNKIFLVTTIGGWRNFYLFENVIFACIKLVDECQVPVHLDIIVGTSKMSEAYKQKIIEMGETTSTKNFSLSIEENKEGILEYLSGSDVLVRSSKIDSYGLCIAEALLVGTPAIATDVCPRPENTLLYSPYDIRRLKSLLKEILNSDRKGYKEPMIEKKDDSYYQLADLYNSLG